MAKIVVPVPQMRKIYEEFHLNAAKSLIVATGRNTQYRTEKWRNIRAELLQVIYKYGEENIFMSQGINMLISALENYLKGVFILIAENNARIELKIRNFINRKTRQDDRKDYGSMPANDFINENRLLFNFQNLEYVNKHYKRFLNISIEEVFKNEKRVKGFLHPDREKQLWIEKVGYFEYLKDKNEGIWGLRHKITHSCVVPEDAKDIFLMLYETLKYFSTSLIEKIYGVDFDKIKA
jgi:hypothetical protein